MCPSLYLTAFHFSRNPRLTLSLSLSLQSPLPITELVRNDVEVKAAFSARVSYTNGKKSHWSHLPFPLISQEWRVHPHLSGQVAVEDVEPCYDWYTRVSNYAGNVKYIANTSLIIWFLKYSLFHVLYGLPMIGNVTDWVPVSWALKCITMFAQRPRHHLVPLPPTPVLLSTKDWVWWDTKVCLLLVPLWW